MKMMIKYLIVIILKVVMNHHSLFTMLLFSESMLKLIHLKMIMKTMFIFLSIIKLILQSLEFKEYHQHLDVLLNPKLRKELIGIKKISKLLTVKYLTKQ